ncbi:MAG: diguanylate cyclase [Candidatus Hydrogenedentes bacterium]|nr:diguanylate cyclase [Candidatus Hydrogenedentota bacterium]
MPNDDNRYSDARILVADDQESIIASVVRSVGDAFACNITTVTSGDEALAALEKSVFDIFLTDMMMPGIHGLPLIKRVAEAYPAMHVVVMTGYPADFPYVEVSEKGAKDFINKPFLSAELIAKLIRILDERIMRHQLEVAHTKYRSLFDLSMDGMLLLTLDDMQVEDVNDAMCAQLGSTCKDILGQSFTEMLVESDQERFDLWMGICARTGRGTIGDLKIIRGNDTGIHFDVTVTMVDADGEQFVFLAFRDITEKREVECKLAEAAERDELTGLYNKRSFTNRIEWAVSSAAESDSRLALLMIDLDNFKRCNDTHGHQVGDKLLSSVGEVIKASIRMTAYDEGFRCGGDEFAVLLHRFVDGGPVVVAARMREKFGAIECYGSSMSIGVAEYKAGMDVAALVKSADDALYAAKRQGRDAVCVAE